MTTVHPAELCDAEHPLFLPATAKELADLGWERPDIILVTGDSYIDSPYIGVAVIGKVLSRAGYKTAVIAQPDTASGLDIKRLGEPALFWGVTGGSVDSLVANYTALKKRRKTDDFTPGGVNNKRPDRAVIQYTNLIRRHFKNTVPIVLGGIEASLRRIAHYDFWTNRIRKSILFDAKADMLVYGMGEKTIVHLAHKMASGKPVIDIPGLCYISKEKKPDYIELPSYETVTTDKDKFTESFHIFYQNTDALTAKGLLQRQDTRYLVQNTPPKAPSQSELDDIHDVGYTRTLHPHDRQQGNVRALDTIRFSIPSHRGCYGECNFCAISVHQGRTVTWRSEASIIKEARALSKLPDFKGTITDTGGPTANMYGFECVKKLKKGACPDKRCLFPEICPHLKPDHGKLNALLKKLAAVKGVKHVFTASGIRYDLILSDKKSGISYLKNVVDHHVSGQLKIAPEHIEDEVLYLMGKPGIDELLEFKKIFDALNAQSGKKQFLTYYFIAGHPGCGLSAMRELKKFVGSKLRINPEQVQIFTPTPSTYSSLMYYTEKNPFNGEKIFVEKTGKGREKQKQIVTDKIHGIKKVKPTKKSAGLKRGTKERETAERQHFMDGKNRKNIRPGCEVFIVLKKDQRSGKLTKGIVKDILTKSPTHPHGIKVRLESGDIGRVKEIL